MHRACLVPACLPPTHHFCDRRIIYNVNVTYPTRRGGSRRGGSSDVVAKFVFVVFGGRDSTSSWEGREIAVASQNREDGCSLPLSPNYSLSFSSQFSRTLLSSAGRGREPRMPVGIWNGAQLKEQFENMLSPFSPYNFCDSS